MKTKNEFWQAVRGFCILAVIIIHCRSGAQISLDTPSGIYYFLLRNLVGFPVCIFFFLSGYFTKDFREREGNIYKFYTKKLSRLIVPYLVYTTFYTIIYSVLTIKDGGTISFTEILVDYFCGGAAAPLYFMIVLIEYTLLTPLLFKCMEKRFASALVIFSSISFLIAIYVGNFIFMTDITELIKLTFIWGVFYYIGLLIGNGKWSPNFKTIHLFCLLPVAFALCLAETALIINLNLSATFAYSQLRISNFLYSFIIIMLLLKFKEYDKLPKPLVYIGDNSYAIFYIHWFFLIVTNSILAEINVELALPLIHIIQFIVMLFGSLVSTYLIKLIFKKKYAALIFGA